MQIIAFPISQRRIPCSLRYNNYHTKHSRRKRRLLFAFYKSASPFQNAIFTNQLSARPLPNVSSPHLAKDEGEDDHTCFPEHEHTLLDCERQFPYSEKISHRLLHDDPNGEESDGEEMVE